MSSNKHIVWYDPNVFKEENVEYFNDYLKKFKTRFDKYQLASQFLSKNKSDLWLVITSNTDGENFVNEIKDFLNVLGVLVFNTDIGQKNRLDKTISKSSWCIQR